MVLPADHAAQLLVREGIEATVVNCRFLKPYDRAVLEEVVAGHSAFLTIEEGTLVNGFGAFLSREIASLVGGRAVALESLGIPDHFVEHGGRKALLADLGLDALGVAAVARALVQRIGLQGVARESA
jgi:1-deoxy-D-xylulose-5-phosphate synthase